MRRQTQARSRYSACWIRVVRSTWLQDHQILFDRLKHAFGLTGRVLDWTKSYLSSRSMYVFFSGNASSVTFVVCGIPQGSILGPLIFLLYTAPLMPIIKEHGFNVHAYADDL